MNHSAELSALKLRMAEMEIELARLTTPPPPPPEDPATAGLPAGHRRDQCGLVRDAIGQLVSDPDLPSYEERLAARASADKAEARAEEDRIEALGLRRGSKILPDNSILGPDHRVIGRLVGGKVELFHDARPLIRAAADAELGRLHDIASGRSQRSPAPSRGLYINGTPVDLDSY